MNRKLLNGLLLLSVATGGVATFTSCKDTEDGLRNEVYVGQKTLGDQIQKIRELSDSEFVQNLDKWIDDAIDSYSNGQLSESGLKGLVLEVCYLKGNVEYLLDWADEMDGRVDALESRVAEIDVILEDLTSRIEDIENWQSDVDDELERLAGEVLANKNALDALEKRVAANEEALGMLQADVKALQEQYEQFADRLNQIDAQVQQLMEAFNESMSKLYSFIANKFAQFITSIPVHQTWNPIFGTINLPIGLQSNIVAGYYFNSDHDIVFPATESSEYEYWTSNPAASNQTTMDNINAMLPVSERVEEKAGVPAMADGNNMGNIFLSINPRNINYEGLEVQLVNSNDEPILNASTLTVAPYEGDPLNFGFTKAEEGSAVYTLPVRMEANWDDINQIAYDIENKSELANALKAAVKDHKISDFATLGHIIYEHLDGFLPAYAVRVGWRDAELTSDGMYSNSNYNYVYSNYNIAATVFRPLSYRTGFGYGINKKLPTFSPFTEYAEKLKERIQDFKMDLNLEIGNPAIDFSDITVTFESYDIVIDLTGAPVVNSNGQTIGKLGNVQIHLTYNGSGNYAYQGDMSELMEDINSALQDAFNVAQDRLQQSLNDLVADINSQLKDLSGSISDNLDDILGKIDRAINGRLGHYADKLVDLYNKLAQKVNVLLKDPNHYLQVMMAYNGGDGGLHHLSTDVNFPTTFVPGNGNAIQLFATSYNADLVVPSYKKYVAITNVYYPWGVEVPGFKGNLKTLNEKAGLNKIFPGAQQRIPISVSNNEFFTADTGYIFEVYYTSLDYRGFTSTQKYYFQIKSN